MWIDLVNEKFGSPEISRSEIDCPEWTRVWFPQDDEASFGISVLKTASISGEKLFHYNFWNRLESRRRELKYQTSQVLNSTEILFILRVLGVFTQKEVEIVVQNRSTSLGADDSSDLGRSQERSTGRESSLSAVD